VALAGNTTGLTAGDHQPGGHQLNLEDIVTSRCRPWTLQAIRKLDA
jgi:hypothetical protein